MVRKIKNGAQQIKEADVLSIMKSKNDTDKMIEFVSLIKTLTQEKLEAMSVEEILNILPDDLRDKFLSIIHGGLFNGVTKVPLNERKAFIAMNSENIKSTLISMIIELQTESEETIKAEYEFNQARDKYLEAAGEIKNIQYDFTKTLRLKRLELTEAAAKNPHNPLKVRRRMEKNAEIIKAIDDFNIIAARLTEDSEILKPAITVSELTPEELKSITAKAMEKLLSFLVQLPDKYTDPREFLSILYVHLFNSDPKYMDTIMYFWLGYCNAIVDHPIGVTMQSFILDTANNIIFLHKGEVPEEDKKNMKLHIEVAAETVKGFIGGLRARKNN